MLMLHAALPLPPAFEGGASIPAFVRFTIPAIVQLRCHSRYQHGMA